MLMAQLHIETALEQELLGRIGIIRFFLSALIVSLLLRMGYGGNPAIASLVL